MENIWSEGEYGKFLQRIFGLELTSDELSYQWQYLSNNKLTPLSPHGGNNIAFTPNKIFELMNAALSRTEKTIRDKRFKKLREEVIPATVFALYLKKIGQPGRLIMISDVPDIVLVDFQDVQNQPKKLRVGAIPIEAVFFPENGGDLSIVDPTERIEKFVKDQKFLMRYRPQTALLITLNDNLGRIDLRKLGRLLSPNHFHQVWLFAGLGNGEHIIAQITPEFLQVKVNFVNDLLIPYAY